MEGVLHPSLLLLLLNFFLAICSAAGVTSIRTTQADFIRTACNSTLYADVCVGCLSPYAAKISHKSFRRLAHVALKETLARAESASASVGSLSSGARPADSWEAGAIGDCAECLANSVELLRRAIWQMKHMGRAGTERYDYHLSDVQTWISGALTDQNTCLDGFPGGVKTTKARATVEGQVASVAKMTSVALALVNMIGGQQ